MVPLAHATSEGSDEPAHPHSLGARRGPSARKQSGQCFFSHQLLFYSLQSGSNGLITEGRRRVQLLPGGGVSKETHITCDFRGGGGMGGGLHPLTPLWIRTWGRLTPLFAYRIMVYQNLNNTQRRLNGKKLSPAGLDSRCGSRGGSGGPDPLENHKLYEFL